MLESLPLRTKRAIRHKAQQLGIRKSKELFPGNQSGEKYEIDETFFDFWTYNSAYVYGYFLADGYMRRQRGSWVIGFSAHTKDRKLLEDIKTVMGSTHPLHPQGNVLRLLIGRKRLYAGLMRAGAAPAKSLALIFPVLPKRFLSAFVRGFFDGDGCATYCKSGRYKYPVATFVANETFIRVLWSVLLEAGISGRIYRRQRENRKEQWSLYIGKGEDIKRLCEWMYEAPCPCLNRKYDILHGGRQLIQPNQEASRAPGLSPLGHRKSDASWKDSGGQRA